jgi:hypothetical protein
VSENSSTGIENTTQPFAYPVLNLINSTVSLNSGPSEGGGIDVGSATVTINNSSIVDNTASFGGAGISNRIDGLLIIGNSIVAYNTAPYGPDIWTSPTAETIYFGNNLIGINPDPLVGPLSDNGGPTGTHPLHPFSAAIDAGSQDPPGSGGDACEALDQRGVERPQGVYCDVGSFEKTPEDGPFGLLKTYSADNNKVLPGSLLCRQSRTNCTDGDDLHADAAHDYAGDTYAFYFEKHGRDSIDDAGMEIVSTVHYGVDYANAFWSSNDQQMVYGDAYGFPLGDDVVGHELTHGVTDYESNLFYYYQSGAINESFSDLWGEFIDQTNGDGDDSEGVKWLLGEDVSGLGAIRDMKDPPAYGDPDKMTSPNYYIGSADFGWFGDYGGVHTNSGVNNKAVYLLTDGDSFNGYEVTGLGIEKVAAIYYEVQTSLLTSGADYKDLYNALYQGCLNLVGGAEGITIADCVEVQDATNAVEMNLEPVPGYNPEAELCPGGEISTTLFYDDMENDVDNWWFNAVSGISSWFWAIGYAKGGSLHLYGYDGFSSSDSFAAMGLDVKLSAGSRPYLHFNHAFGFEDPDYDGGWLEYSTNGGTVWNDASPLFDDGLDYTGQINTIVGDGDNKHTGRDAFVGDSHGYVSSRYNLSTLAGQNVRFRWRMSTDSTFDDLGWVLDDVRVYTCVPGTELLKNGTYDIFVPNWWRGNRLTAADGLDCSTSVTGDCSMRIEGNGKQKQATFITPKSGSAGDNFTFTLWNKAENSGRPFYTKVVLVYTDATQETFRLIPAKGTHDWVQYQLDFSAAKDYHRIRVFLVYAHDSGTVWFDDISLTVGPMSTEVIKNGYFDVFVPTWWRGNRLTATDGPDCSTSATGSCSMRLVGNGKQKQITFITPTSGNAGDHMTFSLWNMAEGSARPFYTKVVLVYTDASQETFRLIPAKGTHEWALYELDITAAKDYNRIRVFLVYGAGSGTVWFDDVSLLLE